MNSMYFTDPTLNQLRVNALSSMELPAHRFFTPTEEFWKYLSKIPKSVTLIDAGCGTGQLVTEAHERKIKMVGIDLAHRPGQAEHVMQLDAVHFPWGPDRWPVICRPSHDGWVKECIANARQRGASVLYVGLHGNFRRDVGENQMGKHIVGKMGEENERLYFFHALKLGYKKDKKEQK